MLRLVIKNDASDVRKESFAEDLKTFVHQLGITSSLAELNNEFGIKNLF